MLYKAEETNFIRRVRAGDTEKLNEWEVSWYLDSSVREDVLGGRLPEFVKQEIKEDLETGRLKGGEVLVFDTETTGIDFETDEILSLGICDLNGKTLFDSFFKPTRKRSWPGAQAVHGIAPTDVSSEKPIVDYRNEIQAIFQQAKVIVDYNGVFDIRFIKAALGFYPTCPSGNGPGVLRIDLMKEYAKIAGQWNKRHGDYRWQKLTDCANYYGYKWKDEAAHNALADAKATAFCAKSFLLDRFLDGREILTQDRLF